MKRVIRKLELARVGKWGADSDEITKQDLSDAVETFTAGRPVAFGHSAGRQDDAPKFGSVWSLDLADGGNTLVGDVEFSPELDALYKDKKYDGWSVSLPRRKKDGKAYLHHLAFLGATPPKVPGLRDLGLAAYDYADGDKVIVHEFDGAIKDLDGGDNNMNPEEIKKLQEELAAAKAEVEKLKGENENLLSEKKELEEKLAKKGDSEEPEMPKEFSDRIAAQEAEMKKIRMKAFKSQIADKVPAGLMDKAIALGDALAGESRAVDFADGGKQKSEAPLDILASILSKMPQPVALGASGIDFADSRNQGGGQSMAVKMMGAL